MPSRADRKNRAFGSKEELYVATAGSRGTVNKSAVIVKVYEVVNESLWQQVRSGFGMFIEG